jgi:AmmeMemoRadiSam system protein B
VALVGQLFIPCDFSKRVFVLGPSHHIYINGCALSACNVYHTPVDDLPLDLESMYPPTFSLKQMHLTAPSDPGAPRDGPV